MAALAAGLLLTLACPVQARQGDFGELIRELIRQFDAREVPATRKERSCWMEAYGVVTKLALDPILKDEAMDTLDSERPLSPLRPVLVGEFSELDSLHAVSLFTRAEGEVARFKRLLAKQTWNRRPDWKNPRVDKAAEELYAGLEALSRENLHVDTSRRYQKAGWTIDVSAAYYLFPRRVNLFVLGSSDGSSAHYATSTVLNLAGVVEDASNRADSVKLSVKLGDVTFDATCRETVLSGRWTDRLEVQGQTVAFSNVLNLRISGSEVQGRWIQSVSSARGGAGRVVYQLRGQFKNDSSELLGTFNAEGDRNGLEWLRPRPSTLSGSWRGELSGKNASGTCTWASGQVMRWEARLEEDTP